MTIPDLPDRIFFLCITVFWANSLTGRQYAISRGDTCLLRLAMSSTLAADFCMLVIYDNTLGLVFFLLTQFLHNLRYGGGRMLAAQAAACLAAGAAGFWGEFFGILPADAQAVLSACYLCAFLFSLYSVFRLGNNGNPKVNAGRFPGRRGAYPPVTRRLITAGMCLFFLCDINVGLYNLTAGAPANGLFRALIWVFYLPGQALLSLSGRRIYDERI
ncbi:MAG: hypothetical protein FWC55_05210 [Firmicutes bacterium]|nr:hypothetical protein [Bacillota bacterium]